MAHQHNTDLAGEPVLAVMFAGYLAGALAMTGHRSPATPRTLLTGLAGGAAIAVAWAAVAVLDPPIPPGVGLAVVFGSLGMATIGIAVERRRGPAAAWGAATTAGTTAALLILNLVSVLSVFGPADLVPHLMPPALPLADQIANSRIELTDRYPWLLLLGWFIALAQWVASRLAPNPPTMPPAAPRRHPCAARRPTDDHHGPLLVPAAVVSRTVQIRKALTSFVSSAPDRLSWSAICAAASSAPSRRAPR
ncbi:hypothetical protein [Dactylosporangium sp. NPDC049140]|uniref:hypothetical protein n=1 Tax=Dactylosporangium sp. NPDC049140 TaxID=3155647 RepID=UPI0034018B5F